MFAACHDYSIEKVCCAGISVWGKRVRASSNKEEVVGVMKALRAEDREQCNMESAKEKYLVCC